MSAEYHLDELYKELAGAERAYAGPERQMDELIYENRDLRAKLVEAELEIARLKGGGAR